MKITSITEEQYIYTVTISPNWFERFFGIKERQEKFRKTDKIYSFGGGAVYRRQDGSELPNNHWIGEAIDKHRRAWK